MHDIDFMHFIRLYLISMVIYLSINFQMSLAWIIIVHGRLLLLLSIYISVGSYFSSSFILHRTIEECMSVHEFNVEVVTIAGIQHNNVTGLHRLCMRHSILWHIIVLFKSFFFCMCADCRVRTLFRVTDWTLRGYFLRVFFLCYFSWIE